MIKLISMIVSLAPLLIAVAISVISYHFGFQSAEDDYNQRLALQNQIAAEQIDAAAHAFIAQQQEANTASTELEQVKDKLTSTAKILQKRNQANAKSNPITTACQLNQHDISLYNDAITAHRQPMLPAAIPRESINAPITTNDLIDNHIDNSLRCTAIEAQLNQLITVIEQQQKETPQ